MKHPRPDDDSWPDPATAEALLNGEATEDRAGTAGTESTAGTDSRAGTRRLAHLLAAAAEPLPGRPADERAALDAFRRTRASARPAAAHRRRPRTAKVLVGSLATVLAFSGVALAAQTGALPHPFRSAPAATVTSPATPRTTSGPPARQPTADHNPAPAPATPHTPAPAPDRRPVGPKGLCTAHGNGGASKVPPYCAALSGRPIPPSPPPAEPSKPVAEPTPEPTPKPTPKSSPKAADPKAKK